MVVVVTDIVAVVVADSVAATVVRWVALAVQSSPSASRSRLRWNCSGGQGNPDH